jgi:hypothetical protein
MTADRATRPIDSSGVRLTEPHRQLICMLAEIAIEQYVGELESNSMTEAPADERQEVAR